MVYYLPCLWYITYPVSVVYYLPCFCGILLILSVIYYLPCFCGISLTLFVLYYYPVSVVHKVQDKSYLHIEMLSRHLDLKIHLVVYLHHSYYLVHGLPFLKLSHISTYHNIGPQDKTGSLPTGNGGPQASDGLTKNYNRHSHCELRCLKWVWHLTIILCTITILLCVQILACDV